MKQEMINIRFNAFSFLKPKLKEKGILTPNLSMQVGKNISLNKLIKNLGLKKDEVAVVFVNHKILPKETILKDGDRVALVPRSYRLSNFLMAREAIVKPKLPVTPTKLPKLLHMGGSSEKTTSKSPLNPLFLSSYLNFLAKPSL